MCRPSRSPSFVRRERRKAHVTVARGEGKTRLGREVDWVIVDFDRRALLCERCGATHPLKNPSLADLVERYGEAFQTLHRDCTKPLTPPPEESK